MMCELTQPVSIRHGRQWVAVPVGARVELIRRDDIQPGDQMRAVLDRANRHAMGRAWRLVRIVDAWPPLARGHRCVIKVESMRPSGKAQRGKHAEK